MHVVRETDQKPDCIVLTGNGKREFDVLEALGEKYDGRKVLWFPKTPLAYLKMKRMTKGFCKFLVLYDREYFKNFNEDKMYLEREVQVRIVEIIDLIENKEIINDKEITGRAFKVKGKFGSRDIEVFVSIQGDEKNINEEISKLIKLKFGEEVEPDDKKIRKFLKERD